MDQAVRESIAALWELLWSDKVAGEATEQAYYDHILTTARAMRAVMDQANVKVVDVGNLIRTGMIPDPSKDKAVDGDDVRSYKPVTSFRDMKLPALFGDGSDVVPGKTLGYLVDLLCLNLEPKEKKFCESVIEWIRSSGKKPSYKQLCWLRDLVFKYQLIKED